MCATRLTFTDEIDMDDPRVIATQLYEMQGYLRALDTVAGYISAAKNEQMRNEWQLIGSEISKMGQTDIKQVQAGLR
ncbi:hypothetical protein MTBPR1_50154 [Candidatus Terasakiella magnetica]|uniref:Uncharacterized protein n=1 Tax=Candidatus Terasakiella magnetica TaxID=1867952 RepID=A0A1C3RJG0_9PROT|nr:hypothetical protein [Candidatus Terasakiella magnetica]SCA57398.1 hypothetical protein MTBPR1_50154 [Candidatus Terasakiella magnetica]